METSSEEVEMKSCLVVPAFLWLVGDGAVDVVVVCFGVFHCHVALHQCRHFCSKASLLCLEYVGEHLQVVTSCTESLAHHGIDIAVRVELIAQGKLREQLVVVFGCGREELADVAAVELYGASHHLRVAGKAEVCLGVVVNLYVLMVVAKSECKSELVGE